MNVMPQIYLWVLFKKKAREQRSPVHVLGQIHRPLKLIGKGEISNDLKVRFEWQGKGCSLELYHQRLKSTGIQLSLDQTNQMKGNIPS